MSTDVQSPLFWSDFFELCPEQDTLGPDGWVDLDKLDVKARLTRPSSGTEILIAQRAVINRLNRSNLRKEIVPFPEPSTRADVPLVMGQVRGHTQYRWTK